MKVIIIAEAGVNHNGKLKIAKKLVDVAKLSNADYVKFQSFSYDKLVTNKAVKANYQKSFSKKNETQQEMLKSLQLSISDQKQLINYCKKKKIKFLSTAFDIDNLKFLLKNNVDFIKVPSGEITNLPLLKFIRSKKKKILLSTGASNLNEITSALKVIKNNKRTTILQCNSAYPTPTKDVNLNILNTFSKKFRCDVGLSDHSLSTVIPAAAVALGAKVIEKHFTLSRKLSGPDHKSSLEPKELIEMIKNIREVEVSLGKFEKTVSISEKENRKVIRKSLVAFKNINKGDKFSKNNITAKRPAGGICPMKIGKILGKTAKRDFKTDEMIKI
jgi:N,N'-diacetyllegionaminate synthase